VVEAWLAAISGFVWGPWFLIPLLVGTGLYLSVVLRGLQFRELGPALWLAFVRRREPGGVGDISHFQALMTALAATVGTGNIAGVATAIAAGGPGALFWMWMTGLVGMATKYAEALLSVRYRETDANGRMSGGPMYFLARGVRHRGLGRVLGAAFALFAAIAAFGIGNGVQSVEVGKALGATFAVNPRLTQGVLAVLVAAVTLGGIRSIARVTSLLVPLMIVFYMGAGTFVLVLNAAWIPEALASVFAGAFGERAIGGGLIGASVAAAMRFGIARGVFSNESGLGSAGIVAAAASTRDPVRQALVSMTQTFIDTLVVCSVTGLAILTTVARDTDTVGTVEPAALRASVERAEAVAPDLDPFAPDFAAALESAVPGGAEIAPLARWKLVRGAEWTTLAFRESLPAAGDTVVSLALALFAFSTILGWSYYGEESVEYLAGPRSVRPYRVLFAAMVLVGPMLFSDTIWLLSDITNGLMAVPNLIGPILLSPIVVSETRRYLAAQGSS
jgi:AGCS family alanine or glycine:cation symporter